MDNRLFELSLQRVMTQVNNVLMLFRRNNLHVIIFSIFVFIFMLLMNIFTPNFADDITNMLVTKSGSLFDDCIYQTISVYNNWSGRIFSTFVVTLFLESNKNIFNIANSIMFLLQIYLLYYLIVGTYKNMRLSVLLYIFLSLFLLTPAFGQDFLWETGSICYLWGVTISVIPLIPLRKQLDNKTPVITNNLLLIFVFFISVISGFALESTSITVLFMYLVAIFMQRTVYKWEISVVAGVLIGVILLLAAPGNYLRVAEIQGQEGFQIVEYIKNLIGISLATFDLDSFLPLMAISIIILLSNRGFLNKTVILFFIGFIICHFSMVGAPHGTYAERVILAAFVFEIVFCGNLIYNFMKIGQLELFIVYSILFLFFLGLSNNVFKSRVDFLDFYYSYYDQESLIKSQIEHGEKELVVPAPHVPKTKYCAGYKLDYITEDSADWVNKGYCRYYHIRSIKSQPSENKHVD